MNAFSRGVKNAFRNGIRTVSVVLVLAIAIGLALAMLVAKNAVNAETSKINANIASQEKNIGTSLTVSAASSFGGMMGGAGQSSNSTSSTTLTSSDLASIQKIPHVASASGILTAQVSTGDDENFGNDSSSSSSSSSSASETNLTAPTVTLSSKMASRFGGNSSESAPTFHQRISLIGVSGASASDNENIVNNYLNSTSTTSTSLKLSSGSMISSDNSGNVAVIGDQLASTNNLKVGSTFTLYGQTVTVGGILDSTTATSSSDTEQAAPGRDGSTGTIIIMSLANMQTLTSQSGEISEIVANVDNINNVSSVTSSIQSQFGNDNNGNSTVSVRSQLSNSQTIISAFNQQKSSMQSIETTALVSLIAAGVAAAVIVFLTMLMIVRERRNEIGVLKAIGAKTRTIVTQFVAESLVLTVIASIIGLAIGIAAATPLTNTLVSSAESSSTSTSTSSTSNSTEPGAGRGNFGGNFAKSVGTVATNINWTIIIDALVFAILVGGIGAAGASLVAVRIRPAEAVRAE